MDSNEIDQQLEKVDHQLIDLLNQRFALAQQVAACKQHRGIAAYAPEQQATLLSELQSVNRGPMPAPVLRAIYREIISGSLALSANVRVAYLGPEGTFTNQAALQHFGSSVEYLPQPTITDGFEAVERERVSYAVVPVENSTEGAVTHTLDMFLDTKVQICAEIHMPIHHHVLSHLPLKAIKRLYSHPQVFGQCRRWLHLNMPDVAQIEVASTTDAASRCTEAGSGALAGALAAAKFQLPIQAHNIEDTSINTTRFLVLGRQMPSSSGDDKTSLLFVIRDRVGALYECLRAFHQHAINLSFIESRPSKRKSWEYHFFVDFRGHCHDAKVAATLDELANHCQYVKILGSYPRAPDHDLQP